MSTAPDPDASSLPSVSFYTLTDASVLGGCRSLGGVRMALSMRGPRIHRWEETMNGEGTHIHADVRITDDGRTYRIIVFQPADGKSGVATIPPSVFGAATEVVCVYSEGQQVRHETAQGRLTNLPLSGRHDGEFKSLAGGKLYAYGFCILLAR